MSQESTTANGAKRHQDMLRQLHEGKTAEEVQSVFRGSVSGRLRLRNFGSGAGAHFGRVPVSEVQRLCDVHSAVFPRQHREIHAPADASKLPGHPAHTLRAGKRRDSKADGRAHPPAAFTRRPPARCRRRRCCRRSARCSLSTCTIPARKTALSLSRAARRDRAAEGHVGRGRRNPRVAEGIRASRGGGRRGHGGEADRSARTRGRDDLQGRKHPPPHAARHTLGRGVGDRCKGKRRHRYCLIDPRPSGAATPGAQPSARRPRRGRSGEAADGVPLRPELTNVLNTLPVDITFVGADDTVRYFSQGGARVFPRTTAIIGRKVVKLPSACERAHLSKASSPTSSPARKITGLLDPDGRTALSISLLRGARRVRRIPRRARGDAGHRADSGVTGEKRLVSQA